MSAELNHGVVRVWGALLTAALAFALAAAPLLADKKAAPPPPPAHTPPPRPQQQQQSTPRAQQPNPAPNRVPYRQTPYAQQPNRQPAQPNYRQPAQPNRQPAQPNYRQPVQPNRQPVQPNRQPVQPNYRQPVQPNRQPVQPGRAFVPPRNAAAYPRPGGGAIYRQPGGRSWEVNSQNHLTKYTRPGLTANVGANGHLTSARLERPDHSVVTINRGPRGVRTVETVRPDGSRVVTMGPNGGYLERRIRPGYIQRTYVVGGRTEVHVYHEYSYRGYRYYDYVPAVRYSPAFYGWAWRPWGVRVRYNWGWYGDPWFGFYRGYFVPFGIYASPALWLTDYLIAQDLQIAYQNRAVYDPSEPPPPAPPQPVVLSPEVKQAIADSVREEMHNMEAPPGPDPITEKRPFWQNPAERDLPISTAMTLTTNDGQSCSLSQAAVIRRDGETLMDGNKIGITVVGSLPGDCPNGASATIDIATLEEVHRQFQEQIGNGLPVLAQNEGKNGIPQGPPPSPSQLAYAQPQPDPGAGPALQENLRAAEQTDAEVSQGPQR